MLSGLSAGRFETRRRSTLERHYPFNVAPGTKRNTFAGATIALEPPCLRLQSAGAVAESNKLIEAYAEAWYSDMSNGGIVGPASTVTGDFRRTIRCLLSVGADQPGNISGAWGAIGYGSFDANTPPAGAGAAGYLQVRRSLADPASFTVVSRTGDSVTLPETATFTNADTDSSMVEIELDPFALSARVLVGGVVKWTLSDPLKYPGNFANTAAYPAPAVEMLLWSGTQTGACTCVALFSGLMVIDYGLNTEGSGLV